jgi:hypothetical protein
MRRPDIHRLYAMLSRRSRSARMRRMWSWLEMTPDTRVLDVGGTAAIWSLLPERPRLVLLNLTPPEARDGPTLHVVGDACRLPFRDGAFEILFSNSLIEHLYTPHNQAAFAGECRRVARRYFVQAPNQRFPLEPHLLTPIVHWLPKRLQARLLRNFTLWGWLTRPDRGACEVFLREVRMPTAREMRGLFPEARLLRERFLGLTKALVAVGPAAGIRGNP